MIPEEAIKALRLMEHVESIGATYDPGEVRSNTTVRELKEACRVAVAALRAQQSRPLDRSRWEAQPVIKRRPYRSERFDEVKLSEEGEVLYRKIVTIHEDWTDDYCSACGKKLCSRFTNYCPACGRPLTEEACAELERRIKP